MTKQYYKNDNIIMRTIEELVPKDHLVRKMEVCMNFTFIEDEVKDLYSDYGRPEKCKNCPLREQYTKSKNMQKVITKHVWEEYKEQMNENRYTQNWKDNYPLRKETVERTFADCKEQMGLRFTRVRGLQKNSHNSTIIFTYHNLKKMALWSWKYKESTNTNTAVITNTMKTIVNKLNFCKVKVIILFRNTTLSTV